MARLSDLQLILLSTANQRESGDLLPLPDSISRAGGRFEKSVRALLKRSMVREAEATSSDQVWREAKDRKLGLVITDAGRSAISGDGTVQTSASREPATAATSPPRRLGTKQQQVLELLRREQGATLGELTHTTGWLPHTTRAALTGLRKRGHAITKAKREDVTCYRIEASA
jgi:hypothetical protein